MYEVIYECEPLDTFGEVNPEEYPLTQKAAHEKSLLSINDIADFMNNNKEKKQQPN